MYQLENVFVSIYVLVKLFWVYVGYTVKDFSELRKYLLSTFGAIESLRQGNWLVYAWPSLKLNFGKLKKVCRIISSMITSTWLSGSMWAPKWEDTTIVTLIG